jgi:hypothetical protein
VSMVAHCLWRIYEVTRHEHQRADEKAHLNSQRFSQHQIPAGRDGTGELEKGDRDKPCVCVCTAAQPICVCAGGETLMENLSTQPVLYRVVYRPNSLADEATLEYPHHTAHTSDPHKYTKENKSSTYTPSCTSRICFC